MEPKSTRLRDEAIVPSTFSARSAGETEGQSESPSSFKPARGNPSAPAGALFPRLEGYELLHLLGRGGMGAVYKARQTRLDRIVALKMIRADLGAGLEERERFRVEAEAAARLQHPNIVQVYEVGQQDGAPYIALEFVGGGSLADHLNGTPLPPRQAAELLEVLARAVHHAHERGVVHRDLKPANVLLASGRGPLAIVPDAVTPWAEERSRPTDLGQPKITDFGLAKCLDSEAARQTRTGAVLGTPGYMAPEQAAGKVAEVGPAADVWALGAILYELLTGRPPFVGPTALEAARQVTAEEPVPPRRLQRTVPRDLETVCLKCLEKDPHQRYASALDLAEDCAAHLRGEPVKARPASVWERGLKWARRRPTAACLIAVSALALVTLLLGAWWYNDLLRAERDEADRQRREALAARGREEAARRLAEANEREAARQRDKARAWFQQARAAVDAMLTRVGEQLPPVTPQAARVRRQLLEDALAFYQGFLKESGADPVIRREAARAYWRVGDIYQSLGEPGRAADAYRGGFDLQEKLVAQFPERTEHARHLGELYHALGLALGAAGQGPAAEKAHRRGIEVLRGLTRQFPREPAYRRSLAQGWCGLGSLMLHEGRWDDAERAARESLELLDRLVNEAPDDLCREMLALSQSNLSTVVARRHRYEEAERLARQSVEQHKKLFARRPTYRCLESLGHALGNWAEALRSLERLGEAEKPAREALEVRRRLARDFPHLASARAELAHSLTSLGILLRASQPDEAAKLHREAIALGEQLVADFPKVADRWADLGAARHNLAGVLKARHPAEARDQLRKAIQHQGKALNLNPRHDLSRQFLRNHYWLLSDVHLALQDHDQALAAAHQMVEVFPKSGADRYRAALLTAQCLTLAEKDPRLEGDHRRRLLAGYAAEAMAHLRQAVQSGYAKRAELEKAPALAPLRGRADFKALLSGK
jgi:eukaryotic-like serine/threonine-protein kinase